MKRVSPRFLLIARLGFADLDYQQDDFLTATLPHRVREC